MAVNPDVTFRGGVRNEPETDFGMTPPVNTKPGSDRSPDTPPVPGAHATKLRPSRHTRAIIAVPLSIAAALFLIRQAVTEYYGLLVRQELAALKTEGKVRSISELAPSASALRPSSGIDEFTARDFKYPDAPAFSNRWPDVGFDSKALTPEQKLAKAYFRFTLWDGFRFSGWIIPSSAPPEHRGPANWDDDWVPFLDKYVKDRAAALERIKRAAASDTARFSCNWSPPYDIASEASLALRRAAELLRVDAMLRARAGDARGAYEDVRLMLRLRHLVDHVPLMDAKEAAARSDSRAFQTLHGIMLFVPLGKQSADTLIAELTGREEQNSVDRALLSEAARGVGFYDSIPGAAGLLEKGGKNSALPFGRLDPLDVKLFWVKALDEYCYLRTMRLSRAAHKKPYAQCAAELMAAQGLSPQGGVVVRRAPMTDLVARYLLMAGQEGTYSTMYAATDAAIARTAIALSLYRAEERACPTSLEALVPAYLPEVQTDPCDGAPLRYYMKDKGFVVYSVGLDGKDSGGQPRRDIVWGSEE